MRLVAFSKETTGAKQLKTLLVAIVLLVSSLVSLGAFSPITHGQTSAVVAVDPSSIADPTITSGTVTFNINVLNSPSISTFGVSIFYNRAVLSLLPTGINFQGDVLAQTGGTLSVGAECLDGSSIIGNCIPLIDDLGVVSLLLLIQGQSVTPNPTNGLLLSLTFNVIGRGVSQIDFLRSILLNGNLANPLIPSQSTDGYFSNMMCGSAICRPPIAQFTFTPTTPEVGIPVTFNGSSSFATNPSASIQTYSWNWRVRFPDVSNANGPIVQHAFQFPGEYTVTLAVNDTYSVVGFATTVVNVIPFPDFTMTPPVIPTLGLGETVTVPLVLTSLNGFTGTVAVSASFSQRPGVTPPAVLLAQNSLKLSPGGTNETQVTVLTTTATSLSFYELNFVGTSNSISHSVSITFIVIGTQPPVFTHLQWKHHVSIARSGNNQTFVADVMNPNNQAAIYVIVHVAGAGSDRITTFATSSVITRILPSQTLADITINGVFSTQEIGLRFSFSTQISWGLNPSSLSSTSNQAEPGVSTTGSIVIAP